MSRAGAILCYHRVAPPEEDPHGLAVSPADFADHVALLRERHGVRPLRDVATHGGVAITFDDGYADNLVEAAPVLAAAGAPATFFVTTGAIGGDAPFWWDRLAAALLTGEPAVDTLELEVRGRPRRADVRRPVDRRRAHDWLHRLLKPLPPEEIDDVVTRLEGATGRGEVPRALTAPEVQALDAVDGLEVGAHTVRHPQLATQPADVQRRELTDARRSLEELLGRAVTLAAYPFGGTGTYDDVTVAIAREAGFELACTTRHRPVHPDADRWRLPRFVVGGDWDADELARRLDRWLQRRRSVR